MKTIFEIFLLVPVIALVLTWLIPRPPKRNGSRKANNCSHSEPRPPRPWPRRLAIMPLLCLLCLFVAIPRAKAQFRLYGESTLITLANNALLTNNAAATTSNLVADVHGYDGVASFLFTCTNLTGSTPTLAVNLLASKDQTNWVFITNAVISTSSNIIVTNMLLGTKCTNTVWFPGPAPFANVAALTNVITTGAFVGELGIPLGDIPGQYLQIQFVTTGTTVSYVYSAFLRARNTVAQ